MASFSIVVAMLATASSPAHHQPACAPMRVMTYNIRLDLESDGANKWSNRRDQFVGQIGLMHPAILGLQEVVRGQQADLEKAFQEYVGAAHGVGVASGTDAILLALMACGVGGRPL